jgi:hypothetical protein
MLEDSERSVDRTDVAGTGPPTPSPERSVVDHQTHTPASVRLRAFGTGLGAGSFGIDGSFIAPSWLRLFPNEPLLVFGGPRGTGLGASSLIADGIDFEWNTWHAQRYVTAPVALRLFHGTSLSSAVVATDRRLLNTSLWSEQSGDAQSTGTSLSNSA